MIADRLRAWLALSWHQRYIQTPGGGQTRDKNFSGFVTFENLFCCHLLVVLCLHVRIVYACLQVDICSYVRVHCISQPTGSRLPPVPCKSRVRAWWRDVSRDCWWGCMRDEFVRLLTYDVVDGVSTVESLLQLQRRMFCRCYKRRPAVADSSLISSR